LKYLYLLFEDESVIPLDGELFLLTGDAFIVLTII